jgi:uncharacterized protein YjbJ (UPF0337 family)
MSAIDKVKNKLQDMKGKGKESAGKATGDRDMEREGRVDQLKSSAKDVGEKIKDAAGNVRDQAKSESDRPS